MVRWTAPASGQYSITAIFLVAIGTLLSTSDCRSAEFNCFTNADGTLAIIAYTGTNTDELTFPATIDGQQVASIGLGSEVDPGTAWAATNITIAEGITNIEDHAFSDSGGGYSLWNFRSITLPGTLLFIHDGAFAGCSLSSISIPDSVTNIGYEAFSYCRLLSSVKLPAALAQIPDSGFRFTPLTNVIFPTNPLQIGYSAFFACDGLTNVVLPNSLRSVRGSAFAGCYGLFSIKFGNNITNIELDALGNCDQLTQVFFSGNSPTTVHPHAFENSTNAVVYYLPGTSGWTSSLGGLPAKLWNPRVQTESPTFGAHANGFGLPTVGTADIPIVLEAAASPVGAPWITLYNGPLTSGFLQLTDTDWTNFPARVYRFRSP